KNSVYLVKNLPAVWGTWGQALGWEDPLEKGKATLSTLRDNRIELVRASWHELSISVSDVSLSDEGQYTCSLFTMPVKTSKAYLTVLDVKYLKEEDANRKTFTVSSTLDFRVDRSDDGVAVICRVDHESLNATPQVAMQVLEIHSYRMVCINCEGKKKQESDDIFNYLNKYIYTKLTEKGEYKCPDIGTCQESFNFMVAITICRDFETTKIKFFHLISIIFPSICHEKSRYFFMKFL
ncbi:hypothetical protein FD754_020946, partial [Muntiacus muntjak]